MLITLGLKTSPWVVAGLFHIPEGSNLNCSAWEIYLTTVLCIAIQRHSEPTEKSAFVYSIWIELVSQDHANEFRYEGNTPRETGAGWAGFAGEGREGEGVGGPSK